MDVDDKDGFGPIKTIATEFTVESGGYGDEKASLVQVADVCIAFLALAPLLQSLSGEPTRDQELLDLLAKCSETNPETFLLVFPLLLKHVRNRSLNLSVNYLEQFLGEIVEIRKMYAQSRNPKFHLFVIQMLDDTMHLWASSALAQHDASDTARMVCKWLTMNLKKERLTSWEVRDALARLYERYLILDPAQQYWLSDDDDSDDRVDYLPSMVLPDMNSDEDIRVRFRVAVINAHLFEVAAHVGQDLMQLYHKVKGSHTTNINE
jgi:serine-protein kinase ATM